MDDVKTPPETPDAKRKVRDQRPLLLGAIVCGAICGTLLALWVTK